MGGATACPRPSCPSYVCCEPGRGQAVAPPIHGACSPSLPMLVVTFHYRETTHYLIVVRRRYMKTIGLIGGLSWESTIEYYRLLNEGVKKRLGGLHSAQCV